MTASLLVTANYIFLKFFYDVIEREILLKMVFYILFNPKLDKSLKMKYVNKNKIL